MSCVKWQTSRSLWRNNWLNLFSLDEETFKNIATLTDKTMETSKFRKSCTYKTKTYLYFLIHHRFSKSFLRCWLNISSRGLDNEWWCMKRGSEDLSHYGLVGTVSCGRCGCRKSTKCSYLGVTIRFSLIIYWRSVCLLRVAKLLAKSIEKIINSFDLPILLLSYFELNNHSYIYECAVFLTKDKFMT